MLLPENLLPLYNSVANYVYIDPPLNKQIHDRAPCEYLGDALKQCETGVKVIGTILNKDTILENLAENAIPEEVCTMDFSNYEHFLKTRRTMMAEKIRKYYQSL